MNDGDLTRPGSGAGCDIKVPTTDLSNLAHQIQQLVIRHELLFSQFLLCNVQNKCYGRPGLFIYDRKTDQDPDHFAVFADILFFVGFHFPGLQCLCNCFLLKRQELWRGDLLPMDMTFFQVFTVVPNNTQHFIIGRIQLSINICKLNADQV
ncbi:hypothetical protein SDC9_89930 [bioreactor metagenome]|uniref:Uncharacterized protein n=1 Tax=bioreactor metagenome TaxID=1076179 RepID=A0A644ZR70_9ZZZZ